MRTALGASLLLISTVASAQTVVYPLSIGDRWQFGWSFTGEPWYPSAPNVVLGDSTMSNGLSYALIRYTDSSLVAERQSGDSVLRFDFQREEEYLLYDFGAMPGDTIGRIQDLDIMLDARDTTMVLGAQRQRWLFTICPPGRPVDSGRYIWVADSLGVCRIAESWGNHCELAGAKVNGITYGSIVAVDKKVMLPPNGIIFDLEAYPNPFNGSLIIEFHLSERSGVCLEAFNLLGQRVAVLADGVCDQGTHHISLDASQWSSSVYVIRATGAGFCQSRRVVLAK